MLQVLGDEQPRQTRRGLLATARAPLPRPADEDRLQPDPRCRGQVGGVSGHHAHLCRLAPEQLHGAQVGPWVGLVGVGELRREDRVDPQVGEAEQVDQQRHVPVGQGRGAMSGAQPHQPGAGVRPGPQPTPGLHERLPILGRQRDDVAIKDLGEGVALEHVQITPLLAAADPVQRRLIGPAPVVHDRSPVRVNAGAVHSYVYNFGDRTDYMSELRAGSPVMIVDRTGASRKSAVGRMKTEIRPLRLIEVEFKTGERVNTIMQDDWHVRIFSDDAKPLNITELRSGDNVLGHVAVPGRHVGIKVDEHILET